MSDGMDENRDETGKIPRFEAQPPPPQGPQQPHGSQQPQPPHEVPPPPTAQLPPMGPPQGPPMGPPPDAVDPGDPGSGEPPRRSRKPLLLAIVAAVVMIAAGAGIGVAIAAGNNDSDTAAKGAPSSTTSGSPGTGDNAKKKNKNGKNAKNGKQGKRQVMRGTITAQSGSTWTVKTMQGSSVKVTITSDTQYGTPKAPATKADFTVGKKVAIVAKQGGSSQAVTAARVKAPGGKAGGKAGGKTQSGSGTASPSASPS